MKTVLFFVLLVINSFGMQFANTAPGPLRFSFTDGAGHYYVFLLETGEQVSIPLVPGVVAVDVAIPGTGTILGQSVTVNRDFLLSIETDYSAYYWELGSSGGGALTMAELREITDSDLEVYEWGFWFMVVVGVFGFFVYFARRAGGGNVPL